jgi:hypothetical protein
MSDEAVKEELERLRKKTKALKKGASSGVRMKVSVRESSLVDVAYRRPEALDCASRNAHHRRPNFLCFPFGSLTVGAVSASCVSKASYSFRIRGRVRGIPDPIRSKCVAFVSEWSILRRALHRCASPS